MRVQHVPARALIALSTLSCATLLLPPPQLSPRVVGCYAIRAPDWSDEHSRVTGMRALPSHIGLDTAGGSRARVSLAWRKADFPATNSTSLTLETRPWQRLGDSIVFDPYSKEHVLGADSIIVGFHGWAGSAVAYLERIEPGYRGSLTFPQLSRPEKQPGIRIALDPAACPTDLD